MCTAATVQHYDRWSLRLDASTVTTPANCPGMIDVWGVATRVGVFEYDDPGGGVVLEYRPPDEVMHADSLKSLRGVPFTVLHPDDDVSSGNARDLTHGWVLDVVPAGSLVKTQIRIATDAAKQAIEQGLVELSCGYNARLEKRQGFTPAGERYDAVQRDIRYNHLALVDQARAGPVARLHLDSKTTRVQRRDQAAKTMKKRFIRHDGKTYRLSDLVLLGLQSAADSVESRGDAIETAKITIETEGEAPVELIVPVGMAEQALAMLGASPAEASSVEPPPSPEDPAMGDQDPEDPNAMGDAADEDKENMDKADAKKVDAAVARALATALPKALEPLLAKVTQQVRTDAAERAELERKVVSVLGDGYRFADADSHRVRADAIAQLDPKRADEARRLADQARKGDAVAAGRLIASLDFAIERDRDRRDSSAEIMGAAVHADADAPTPDTETSFGAAHRDRVARISGRATA